MRRSERVTLALLVLAVVALAIRQGPAGPAAYGARADADEALIAVCAIPTLVNELMASDRFAPEREALEDEFRERLEDMNRDLRDLRERLEAGGPDDPDAQRNVESWRELTREMASVRTELQRRLAQLSASQLAECYDLAKSSAVAVAEDLGFVYLIASGDPDEDLVREDSQTLLRQITARPMLLAPEEADITGEVRDDLNL